MLTVFWMWDEAGWGCCENFSGPLLHDGVCRMGAPKMRLLLSATRVCMLPIQWVSTQIDVIGEWQLLGAFPPHCESLPFSDVSDFLPFSSRCCLLRGEGGVFDLPHSRVCRPFLHVCSRPNNILIVGSSDQSLLGHPPDCWDFRFPESFHRQYPPATEWFDSLSAPFCEPCSVDPSGFSVCHNSLKGVRIGEAANPGPGAHFVVVCNPTTFLSRVEEVKILGDTILVSETSATCDAQKSIRSQLSSSPFRVHWGAPAQVKNSNADARRANMRGCATGVACLTKFLSRSTRASDCPFDMVKAGRLMKCLVRWGNMCIQVIVVYGVVSQKGSWEANEELMRQICEMVIEYPGQSLIGGDFNLPPQHLDAFQGLARLGYRELFSYYSDTRGVDLPPTCNLSTRHDTLIIPPVLLPSLTSAEV